MAEPIRVALGGSEGRMGNVLKRLFSEYDDMVFWLAVDPRITRYKTFGELLSNPEGKKKLYLANVYVDFTVPDAVIDNVRYCSEAGIDSVIGTTGWYKRMEEVAKIAEHNDRRIVWAPNYSIGANILFHLTEIGVKELGKYGFDGGVLELHHRGKKDAPSGTAIKLGEILRKLPGREKISYGRTDKISDSEVDVGACRVGAITGRHEVVFSPSAERGDYERLTITHNASNRDTFGHGVLEAVRKLYKWGQEGQEPGLYAFKEDVLGLRV